MTDLFENFSSLIDVPYVLSVVFATFIVLYYFVNKPPERWKFIITALIGLLLGIVWIIWIDITLSKLIVSFLFSSGFYTWLIKPVMKRFKISYKDK